MPPRMPLQPRQGGPTVAFAPLNKNPVTCGGLVNVIWFHGGSFQPTDQYFDISIAPVVSAGTAAQPVAIAHAQDALAERSWAIWPRIVVPEGHYIINGSAVDDRSRTVFQASDVFYVAPGPDNSCITTLGSPSSSSSTSSTDIQPAATSSSASSSTASVSLTSSSTTTTTTSTATFDSTTLPHSQTVNAHSSNSQRIRIIAGSAAGAGVALLLLILLTIYCCCQRKYEEMPPGWKRISHVERMAAAAPSAPRRREKPPLAVVPPDLERPAVMVQVTRASAEAAGLGAQSMYLTVPAYAAYSTPATRERERGRENSHSTATDSESQSRATVLSRFGWAVPITPMFNLVMSRRSSAGSSRFVSPGGPLETPRMGVKFPRAEPDQQSDKSKQGSEVTRLTGFEYDREAVHSLSDFQWAEIATPQRSPAPSQTMHSFLSDMQSDRSANVLDRLDRLPEIPGEEIGSGEETETEKTPTKRRGKAKAAVSKP